MLEIIALSVYFFKGLGKHYSQGTLLENCKKNIKGHDNSVRKMAQRKRPKSEEPVSPVAAKPQFGYKNRYQFLDTGFIQFSISNRMPVSEFSCDVRVRFSYSGEGHDQYNDGILKNITNL